jgi:hypothetical protein
LRKGEQAAFLEKCAKKDRELA